MRIILKPEIKAQIEAEFLFSVSAQGNVYHAFFLRGRFEEARGTTCGRVAVPFQHYRAKRYPPRVEVFCEVCLKRWAKSKGLNWRDAVKQLL